jgi:HD-like signal output (HDOD) protein
MKIRILFVDDEPNILAGLRRMARSMRSEWEAQYASCGQEAIALLESHPCDIVVSDMRMPGMDGVELLSQVQQRFPDTVRVVLSGHSDPEAVIKSVKPAHQFLSKPCTPGQLKQVVTNAMSLRPLLKIEEVRKLVSQVDVLPSVPELYQEIMEVLESERSSLKIVGEIISRDVAMTASILKLVNSSFFGFFRHIATPEEAVALLGTEVVKSLVLTRALFSTFDAASFPGYRLDTLWEHSLNTASFAKAIAGVEAMEKRDADNCFMAGMLHDVGKLVFAANMTTMYQEILARAQQENRTVQDMEKEIAGASHGAIGGYLLGLWGLPYQIIDALAHHHDPARGKAAEPSVLTVVHAANSLEHELVVINRQYAEHPMDMDYLERLGLTQRIPVWRETCSELLRQDQEA